MKFTSLEPLNQKFNEALKRYDLKKIKENSNIVKEINNKFSDNNKTIDRIFDDSNETCSQIFIKVKDGNIKYANVFITDSDLPEYTRVFVVE